ncbi:MAG TPA: beta-propeller fold lactonase family protein [Solirubrobacteraceae bacterium]|nr:beta-propeller fold lactonase family protein [Solirubrobacteraceae bacterium]
MIGRIAPRRALTICQLALVCVLAVVPVARADTAKLAGLGYLGCVSGAAGFDGCTATALGMRQPSALAVSADGRNIYIASRESQTVDGFAVGADGTLSTVGCVALKGNGANCAATSDVLTRPIQLVVSPDGAFVYAISDTDPGAFDNAGTIAILRRDAATGALGSAGCVKSPASQRPCGTVASKALSVTSSIAISPDGANIYVSSAATQTIVSFARNSSSGGLREIGCVQDPESIAGCNVKARGTSGVSAMTFSPDGHQLYAAAAAVDTITAFARDSGSGQLSNGPCYIDSVVADKAPCTSVPQLQHPAALAVSPDGRNLYVGSIRSGSLSTFARDPGGALTFKSCVQPPTQMLCGNSEGLANPVALAISPDGTKLVLAMPDISAVSAFTRDPSSGAVTFSGCVTEIYRTGCGASAAGLLDVTGLAFSPQGDSIYVSDLGDNALTEFSSRVPVTPPPSPPSPMKKASGRRHKSNKHGARTRRCRRAKKHRRSA